MSLGDTRPTAHAETAKFVEHRLAIVTVGITLSVRAATYFGETQTRKVKLGLNEFLIPGPIFVR